MTLAFLSSLPGLPFGAEDIDNVNLHTSDGMVLVLSLIIAVMAAYYVVQEGESNWFEGLQLLALYAVLGVVFYFA